jgi:tetratricopeptide (TPR) repeat protein
MESGTLPTASNTNSNKPNMPAGRETIPKDALIGLLVWLILIVLCIGVSFCKIKLLKRLPFFNPNDGLGFYWTENAFHFRHAQMVAEGKGIPVVDIDIQYPEGLNIRRYITPFPDWVSGSLYRLLSPAVPLHVFLIYFVSIFSTLSVVAVFLAGRILWRSNWAGIISALFYCVSPASFARTTAGSLLREDFALPFIFLSFACFLYTLREDRPLVALIGSLLLTIALAAWHLTQFYLLLFVVGLVIIFFLQKKHSFPRLSFTVFTVITTAGALALPVLRAKLFVFSFPLMLSYAMLIPLWLPQKLTANGLKRRLWAFLAIVLFLAAALIIQKHSGSYSHVWSLILAKFRYFARPPRDPSLIPFEARVFWAAGFVTPSPKAVLILLSTTGLLGAAALLGLILRILMNRDHKAEIILVYFALCFLLLFFIIYRLHVFAVFFLSLPIGYLVTIKSRLLKTLAYLFLAACFVFSAHSLRFIRIGAARPSQVHLNDVIKFIKANSGKNEAVLSSFQFGPAIAAYTQRPVILHSSFESKRIRDKVKEVYTALYDSEQDFYRVCRKYDASLFVYESDMTLKSSPGSTRYITGRTSLATNSAAAMFQFAPERLKHFGLVHQNDDYRVFRVAEKAPQSAEDLPYIPFYDLSFYYETYQVGENIDDRIIAAGLNKLRRPQTHQMLAQQFLSKGDTRTAILEYQRALALNPNDNRILLDLGQALYQFGEKDKGLQIIRIAVNRDLTLATDSLDIQEAAIWMTLGLDELAVERFQRAESFFRKALELEPESGQANLLLGVALLQINKIPEAKEVLGRAISYEPDSYEAYNLLGRAYTVSGEYDKAIQALKKSLSLNPDQPHLTTILNELMKHQPKAPAQSDQ